MRGSPRPRGWDALVLVARAEVRRRWRSHVVLAVIAAMAVAAVVIALTAAARSENAFSRLRAATRASDVVADYSVGVPRAVAEIRRLPGVVDAVSDAELFVRPRGSNYFPDYNLWARAPVDARDANRLNVPVITKGRPVRQQRADEVVLSAKLASHLGLGVGDVTTLESMTSKWVDAAFNGGDPGPPDGPRIRVTVVGISRSPVEFGRFKGLLNLSSAFVARYGTQMRVYHHIDIRLSTAARHRGVARALRNIPAHGDVGQSPFADDPGTDEALSTTATTLRLLAAVAAIAGAAVLALALVRLTRRALDEDRTLVALGWTKRQRVASAWVMFTPWILIGVTAGVVIGTVLAPRAMVGVASSVDPTPGAVVVDKLTIVATTAVTLALALIVLGLTARGSTGTPRHGDRRPARLSVLRRPLPLAFGVRNALGGGASGGRASRAALAVMTVGVASIVITFTVSASISRLQTDPSLTGQAGARVVDSGESLDAYDRALPVLEKDRRVALLAGIHVIFGIRSRRAHEMTGLAYDLRRGTLPMSVVHGRPARESDEVALGPVTLDRLQKHVGDTVDLREHRGTRRFRIVGSVLFPEGDFTHDDGIALTTEAANRIVGNARERGAIHQVVFDWADGVNARAADRDLAAAGIRALTQNDGLVPPSVHNLGQVDSLPPYLAILLVVMSLVTLALVLSAGVRSRTREFGVLQALGMTPRAVAIIVASQALTILGIALLLGLPIGLVVGTRIWTPIANGAHVVILAVKPPGRIAIGMASTAVVAAAISAVAASRAAHVRAGPALRSE